MNFDFVTAGRIVFGPGRAAEAGASARPFGSRCLLIRGRGEGADTVKTSLQAAGLDVVEMRGPGGEPDETDVDGAVPSARETRPDLVVAVGGGSVLDFAKAVAALVPQGEAPVRDYLEGVGTGRKLAAAPLPLIACPTTAGTGSEVTKNAVISSRAGGFKKSLRDNRMMPAVALVDPDLQAGAPRHVRVWSGLDALTQNIEAYLSRKATPLSEALALRGVEAAGVGLTHLADGDEAAAQEPMALSALLSGLALANGGLGAAHGLAQALGIHGVPHGLACASALPWVLSYNGASEGVRKRMHRLAPLLMPGTRHPSVGKGSLNTLRWVWNLTYKLGVPHLADLAALYPGVPALDQDGAALLAREAQGNSLSGNPVPLDAAQVANLLGWARRAPGPLWRFRMYLGEDHGVVERLP